MRVQDQLYQYFTPEEKEKLRQIQDVEIKLLKELDRICTKYNCNYSLAGGTLLGCIRHKDFIPWDDDIDIDLKRDDFNKIVSVLPYELGDEFEFVNYYDHENYFCDFIPRIFYKNSSAVTSHSPDGGKTNFANDKKLNRIFIELYCLHDTDSSVIKKQLFELKSIYGLAMAHRYTPSDSSRYTMQEKAEATVLSAVGKYVPLNEIYEMYEKCVNKIETGKGDSYFKPSAPIPVQERNVFPKWEFESFVRKQFRNDEFFVPAEYERVLESLYSNWQSLPKESDRHPGHFLLSETTFK